MKFNKNKLIIMFILIFIIAVLVAFAVIFSNNNQNKLQEESNKNVEIYESKVEENKEDIKEEKIKFEYQVLDKWQSGDKICQKYSLKLKNISNDIVNSWKVELNFKNDINISQNWNCDVNVNNNILEVSPKEYNKEILSNSEVEVGMILEVSNEDVFGDYNVTIDNKVVEFISNNNSIKQEENIIKEEVKENIVDIKDNDSKTPVEKHGKLNVKDTYIVDSKGEKFLIQGISTHGIAWYPEYVNKDTFKTLRDDFNVNTIRLAFYSDYNAGYNENLYSKVHEGVKYATELGMYVIIDWHILADNNPNINKANAEKFFKEMTNKYKDYENVIYEICNEPNGNVSWDSDVKPYAESMISLIRNVDDDAIIIVGTPDWSKDLNSVIKNPIKNQKNIIYAFHYYAATHKENERNIVQNAINNNIPVLISEFGICDASGNGNIDINEANLWINFLRKNSVGYVCWNLSNKNESSAMINSNVNSLSNFKDEELSVTGKWIKNTYNNVN